MATLNRLQRTTALRTQHEIGNAGGATAYRLKYRADGADRLIAEQCSGLDLRIQQRGGSVQAVTALTVGGRCFFSRRGAATAVGEVDFINKYPASCAFQGHAHIAALNVQIGQAQPAMGVGRAAAIVVG